MDTSRSVLHSARRFLVGTFFSRISGALRDITMAICFGSTPEVGAFMVAYRLANLFRRLFGEGSMQAGLIPHFTEQLGEKESALFYRDSMLSFTFSLLGVLLVVEWLLWGISQSFPEDWKEITILAMQMLPGLIFICLFAINSAFLQAKKRYFLSGFAPVMFNCSWIVFSILAKDLAPKDAMNFLSIGVTFAFFAQWVVTQKQVHSYLPLNASEWSRPTLFSEEFRKIIRPVLFGVVGVGAMQANSAIDTIFSRFADLSGPAYLWYAIRIEQLPLALFGVALSGALLPSLSRAVKEGALERYKDLLQNAIRHSTAILVPCTFGIFCLGGAGLNLLYGHGDFSSRDVLNTLKCLWGYGLGLIPSVLVLLMGSAFYAKKSYGTPTLISVASILFHLGLNTLFVFYFHFGAFSIALSTSLSSFFNCILLSQVIRKKLQIHPFAGYFPFFGRLCVAGVTASVITLFFGGLLFHDPVVSGGEFTRSVFTQSIQVASTSGLFVMFFFILSRVLNLSEVFEFLKRQKGNI